MKLLQEILKNVNVLVLKFRDPESCDVSLLKCRYKKGKTQVTEIRDIQDPDEAKKELTAFPVLVFVCGYGVISKEIAASSEVAAKVTAPDSGFIWNEDGGVFSFVRAGQLEKINARLDEIKAKVLAVRCGSCDGDNAESIASSYVNRYYSQDLKFRNLVRVSPSGSAMAQLVAGRLKFPVLGIILLLLMVNAMAGPGIRSRYESGQAELQLLQNDIGRADDITRRKREMVTEYNRSLPRSMGWLCDRAALALPDQITLTSFSIQPLMRSLEENKKPVLSERGAVITGEAVSAEHISEYVAGLNRLGIASKVNLSAMEFDRDKGLFVFRINMEL